ncbi:MAG: endonuclease III [Myxococcota bacterium]
MRRAAKADTIQTILDQLYPDIGASFLDHRDSYTLLIAVLLSAQCTDARVNKTTPDLFAIADNPYDMVQQEIDTIRAIIRPCGLSPTKAKNIWHLSQMLIRDHGGNVPGNLAALEKLPGVGHKTASVVMAQAFDEPMFPVDTHIHRLAGRWGLSKAKNVTQTERDLKAIFPRERWNTLHLQIIQFGRDHCPALYHDLTECPICSWAATKKRIHEEAKSNQALRQKRRRAR